MVVAWRQTQQCVCGTSPWSLLCIAIPEVPLKVVTDANAYVNVQPSYMSWFWDALVLGLRCVNEMVWLHAIDRPQRQQFV